MTSSAGDKAILPAEDPKEITLMLSRRETAGALEIEFYAKQVQNARSKHAYWEQIEEN
jgi:hypothetical protein